MGITISLDSFYFIVKRCVGMFGQKKIIGYVIAWKPEVVVMIFGVVEIIWESL